MFYSAIDLHNKLAGSWEYAITSLAGVDPDVLSKRAKPCPCCGGRDRFRYDNKDNRGTWYCNHCGGRDGRGGAGDGIMLIAKLNGWTFKETIKNLAEWLGDPGSDTFSRPRYKRLVPDVKVDTDEQEDWTPVDFGETELDELRKPIVSIYLPKKKKHWKTEPKHLAVIRDIDGVPKGAVVRAESYNGKKIPVQVQYAVNKFSGECNWIARGLGSSKPLYGIETIGDSKRVILVQGERKRDICLKYIKDVPVISVVGGDNNVVSNDFSPLCGRIVLIWPDADENKSGMRCAAKIAHLLDSLATVKVVIPPAEKVGGWDLANAFEEDGWTYDYFVEYVKNNLFKNDPRLLLDVQAFTDEDLSSTIGEAPVDKEKKPRKIKSDEEEEDQELNTLAKAQLKSQEEWPDPIDFFGNLLPPSLDYSMLPKSIGEYIAEQSDLIGSDPGVMVVSCLIALAGSISDNIKLSPKKFNSGWLERACLWGAFVGEPSAKKSPSSLASFKPLKNIEEKLAIRRKEATSDYKDAMEKWTKSKGDKIPKPTPPIKTRIIASTATIEAIRQICADNPRGILCLHDELTGWFGSMDAYGRGGTSKDRPLWLELYNGGHKSWDTATGGEVWIDNWSSSIYGNIQPDAIRKIVKGLPDDGLLQRFFVVVETQKSTNGADRQMNMNIKNQYDGLIKWLFDLDATYSFKEDVIITLSEGALEVKERFFTWARESINAEILKGGLSTHVGKYEGLYSRLLIIYHLVDCYERGGIFSNVVREETAEMLSDFMRYYLFPHSVYFYSTILGGSDNEKDVTAISKVILTSDTEMITNRDLSRRSRDWRTLTNSKKIEVMSVLDSFSWVTAIKDSSIKAMPKGWLINPKIKIKFEASIQAEAERMRKARELIIEMGRLKKGKKKSKV